MIYPDHMVVEAGGIHDVACDKEGALKLVLVQTKLQSAIVACDWVGMDLPSHYTTLLKEDFNDILRDQM